MLRKVSWFPIISAILLVFTFPQFNLEFLAWVALIPLFFALENKKIRQRFIIGYIFGVVFFSGILYWLINVTVPGAIVLILLLSFAPAIFTCLFRWTMDDIRYIFFAPSAWVLTEYLRTHLFTGFPWALLGYSQSFNLPVIQIADITGVYGVSFLIVLVNFGLYLALRKRGGRFYLLSFIFFVFILTFGYGQNRISHIYPAQSLRVSVIQGNILQDFKWDPQYREFIIDTYKMLTRESLKEGPNLVVWPETSLPGYLEEADLKGEITGFAKSGNIHILAGTFREEQLMANEVEPSKMFNSATLISNKGKILESYDKIHLVPFGEFVPFERKLPWIRSIVDKPIGDFERGSEFTVFEFKSGEVVAEGGEIKKTTEFHSFSTLICFEDIFPGLSRNFVKKGARFLVNITNDAWFGKSASPYQHSLGSIFRAVENRVPVVRAANTGLSCIIDHKGRILKSVKVGKDEICVEGHATETITPTFARTIYTRFGDLFSWICIGLVLFGMGTGAFRWGQVFLYGISLLKHLSPPMLAMVLLFSFVISSEAEIHYKGRFKFPFPFGRRYSYDNILVTKVIDGDTLELQNRKRVRLIGIDTPEVQYNPKLERDAQRTKRDYKTIMEMGRLAAEFTKNLVEGKRVRLEFDVEKRDSYGRLLAYVYLLDGRMVNAELVKVGYAQVYTFPPNVKYVEMFLKLQKDARNNNRGLWKES